MNVIMIFIVIAALILGILFAMSTGFLLTMIIIKKSNNLGSEKGNFRTFVVKDMTYYKKIDNLKENQVSDHFR